MSQYLSGVEEFKRLLQQVEKVPAKTMTYAVKKAANVAKADAKSMAPPTGAGKKTTGNLRRAIGIWAEKRRTGKKIYQLAFSKNYNDKLVKYTKTGKRYYYPASQEYGFKKRGSGEKIEGKYFIRRASKDKKQELEQMIVDELANSLKSLGGAT